MIGLCLRKVPNQATKQEINIMRRLLLRKRFAHWPICSVWGYALRKGHVSMSLSSWYNYNKKFQFRITRRKSQFQKRYYPLRAPYSNHTWHADITIVRTLDNVKHYVYLIVDNFSKFILNWKVAGQCSGQIRTQTLREAIRQEFGDTLDLSSIDLIVDGGPENNNRTIEQYIKASQVDITKMVALKDIIQSNSMVEASNKILKHRYLFRTPLYNLEHLEIHLKEAIHDYCHVRPHYALGPFTPFEVQYDQQPDIKTKEMINHAVKERRKSNQMDQCSLNCR